jgi:hypothetical protein
MKTIQLLLNLTLPLLAGSAAMAQSAPNAEAQTLTRVEITQQRDPEFIPYRDFFASIEKFEQLRDRDRIALILRVVPQRNDLNLSDLKVRLVGDGDYTRPIEVSKGGRLAVPYDRRALDHNADFMFNVKRGSLKPEINVLIRFNGQTTSYRELMDSLKQADKAERELMTFAQRLLFPHSNAVAAGFGEGVRATITIGSARLGTQRLETNRRGVVGIEFNDELYAENPVVEFSSAPDWLIAAIAPRKSEAN